MTSPAKNTTPRGRVIQLDFVRGIAILAVMKYHFTTVSTGNRFLTAWDFAGGRIGWIGVDFFFVLSGFLIGGLLIEELIRSGTLRLRRFFVRRALKIWPAYYVYLLFQVVLHRHPFHSYFWQNLLNVQNYAGTSLNHTWSLAVEEHFYLFLPPLLWLLYRNSWTRARLLGILLLLCGGVLVERVVGVYVLGWHDLQWLTHARIDSLLFGVLLSWAFWKHRTAWDRVLRGPLLLGAAGLAGVVAAAVIGQEVPWMWSVGYTVNYLSMAALLLLVYRYDGWITQTWFYRAIAWVGLYSYGIYLWHLSVREPIARFATSMPHSLRWVTLLIGQYSAAIVLGVLMTELVEFPMTRIRDRVYPRSFATQNQGLG